MDYSLTHNSPDELKKLMILVEQGNPEAQYHLACSHLTGSKGVEINLDRALELFIMSSSAGFPASIFNLAMYHLSGFKHVRGDNYHHTPNLLEVAKLIKKSAELGFPAGMAKLGEYYAYGTNGVVQNYLEAFKWLDKSSKYGIADSFYYLGAMHQLGLGVDKDLIEAHKFFNLAVTYSSAKSEMHGKSIEFREDIENSLSKIELNEAHDRALKFNLIPFPEESKLKLYGTTSETPVLFNMWSN